MLQSILKFIFLFALSMFCNITSAQKTAKLFDDKQISEIHISIDPDTVKYIINKNLGAKIHYDSDMGFGAGITVNY